MVKEEENNIDTQTESVVENQSISRISDYSGTINVEDINELDKTVDELFESQNGVFNCKVCGKINSRKQNMQKHVEIHIEGLSFDCQHRNKTFRSRESLRIHKHKRHS